MVRTLCCVRLVVLLLAAGQYLGASGTGSTALTAIAAAPFSFVPALNWRTRGPSYFRNGVLLAADLVVTVIVLVDLRGLPLMGTYAAATVALWGVTVGLWITLVMAIPVAVALVLWTGQAGGWRARALVLFTLAVIASMAFAGSMLGRDARRRQETELLLAQEREALATLEERLRIARDLHDTVAGDLAGLTMLVQALSSRLATEGVSEQVLAGAQAVDQAVREAHRHTRAALEGLRSTAGTVGDGVEELAAGWSERTGVAVRVHLAAGLDTLPSQFADSVVLVVRELLENVRKHAQATVAEVRVESDGGRALRVSVQDDGCGFAPLSAVSAGHHGIQGIRERAESFGGRAEWGRSPLGGTAAEVTFPVGSEGSGAAAPGPLPVTREVA